MRGSFYTRFRAYFYARLRRDAAVAGSPTFIGMFMRYVTSFSPCCLI